MQTQNQDTKHENNFFIASLRSDKADNYIRDHDLGLRQNFHTVTTTLDSIADTIPQTHELHALLTLTGDKRSPSQDHSHQRTYLGRPLIEVAESLAAL